ncbi:MAG: alpha-mannosidase [Synechococcus sp.]
METDRRLGQRHHLMGQCLEDTMQNRLQTRRSAWIETFRSRSRLDLLPEWSCIDAPELAAALDNDWAKIHRPDWAERGLLSWPRGGLWKRLRLRLLCPEPWRRSASGQERLVLSWWADQMRLWVDGVLVQTGDLFDTRCRWRLPPSWRQGQPLDLLLELRSPCHDDGALITSEVVREPLTADHDPEQLLLPQALDLALPSLNALPESWLTLAPDSPQAVAAVLDFLSSKPAAVGEVHWIGHAHLDLAWLWPVADTWQAAERTFRSALDLMEDFPALRFAHSTPALYAWMERFRPALWSRLQAASAQGRWEPINGPWVESDCVLVSTASLWQQFAVGQDYSRNAFPQWRHDLAWLPDSFGFAAGVPAVAAVEGVRWLCTHKLAWNAGVPFPHRLFRWRSRGRAEIKALMLPPIGTNAEPAAIEAEQRAFHRATGLSTALWTPGVGDHGGGPTAEMLEQMRLWDHHPQVTPRRPSTVRGFLAALEPSTMTLPVWRDELYLDLHRACATSRPDQKRHNRSLERLLREADLTGALLQLRDPEWVPETADWTTLLFHQFHDILPGTSIPEVFEQAEPLWRRARRSATALRHRQLKQLLGEGRQDRWAWVGLQPLARWSPLVRLPQGAWSCQGHTLAMQVASQGGTWVQLPEQQGVVALPLERGLAPEPLRVSPSRAVRGAVTLTPTPAGGYLLANNRLSMALADHGVQQLWDGAGRPQLQAPIALCRFRDHGEFWDAWDLPADYRDHPLPVQWESVSLDVVEAGPLVARVLIRARAGESLIRLDCQLRADCPWVELTCSVDWRQTHELLRLEVPLAQAAIRWTADTSGGVIARPTRCCTPGERMRWEVPVISWCATEAAAPGGGLALLLDGPQGMDATPDRLGVSLLRGSTWPDPAADRGWHRQRLALMPTPQGWCRDGVPQAAIAFREPGWWGPAALKAAEHWLPPLPIGLVPVAVGLPRSAERSSTPSGCVRVRVLNPGSRRQTWRPEGWRLGRLHDGTPDGMASQQVVVWPGELVELVLIPDQGRLAQSS